MATAAEILSTHRISQDDRNMDGLLHTVHISVG